MELLQAEALAISLMDKYGLIEKGWFFIFDKAKRRFGCCSYRRRCITLSAPLTEIREESFVRNTILHEIAHALVGGRNGHNEVWRAKAIEIGCNGERCSNDARLEGKWKGLCPNGHIHYRHRRPKRKTSCGVCLPKRFDSQYLINFQVA